MHRRLQSFIIIALLSVVATACKATYDHSALVGGTSGGGTSGGGGGLVINDGWDRPISINDNFGPASDGTVLPPNRSAMDSSGNAIIVWHQEIGGISYVFKSEYRNGAWTHPTGPTDYINPDGGDAEYPSVAMDDNGNAIIAWTQSDGNNFQIFKSEYRNGAWTHPTGLDDNISPDGHPAEAPEVATDDNGNAIIVWSQALGGYYENNKIFISEYRSGVWTHPTGIDDYISQPLADSYVPRVAMDNNGNAVIAWDGGNIYKSEYRNGAWTHPGMNDYLCEGLGGNILPAVAMDNNGNAIIAWHSWTPMHTYSLLYRSEYRNGVWTHPTGIGDHIHTVGVSASSPSVVMNDNGQAIIAYVGDDGSNDAMVFKSEYRNGIWVEPEDLDDHLSINNVNSAAAPHVAMDNNGNAVIAWLQAAWYGNQIFKAELRNGLWTGPVDIDDTVSIDESNTDIPWVVMNDQGMALISWSQKVVFEYNMFKAEYGF